MRGTLGGVRKEIPIRKRMDLWWGGQQNNGDRDGEGGFPKTADAPYLILRQLRHAWRRCMYLEHFLKEPRVSSSRPPDSRETSRQEALR